MVQGKCKFSKFDRECKVYDEEEHLQIKAKQIDKDKWFVVPDTHEAIISKEDFEITQGLLERNSRTINFSNISLFSGMIKCGDCGKALVKNKSGNTVQYICSKYRQLGKTECTRHTIREDMLIEMISKELERRGIEIVEVVLDRDVGKGNPPRSLDCQFSEQIIARNHLVFQFFRLFLPFCFNFANQQVYYFGIFDWERHKQC